MLEPLSMPKAKYNFFEKILNEVSSLVFVRDANGYFVYLNEPFAKFLDREIKDVFGKHLRDIYLNEEHYSRAVKQDQEIIAGKEGFSIQEDESSIANPNVWMQVNKRKIVVDEQPYVLGLLVDISKLKEAEKQLYEANKELTLTLEELRQTQNKLIESEKMASLGTLSAGLSHEINNPLNYIKGAAEGISRYFEKHEKNISEDLTRFLDIINEGISRTSNIVVSLSSFSQSKNQKYGQCHIEKVLHNCLVVLNNQLKQKATIEKYYNSKPTMVLGNEGQLHQAFLNIVTNAIQSIPNKGIIKLSTKSANGKAIICIEDDGVGISKKNINHIMEPFFTTKSPGEGTGLGLSIAYKIIETHGGTIGVKSKEGSGSEVTIYLPIIT